MEQSLINQNKINYDSVDVVYVLGYQISASYTEIRVGCKRDHRSFSKDMRVLN